MSIGIYIMKALETLQQYKKTTRSLYFQEKCAHHYTFISFYSCVSIDIRMFKIINENILILPTQLHKLNISNVKSYTTISSR